MLKRQNARGVFVHRDIEELSEALADAVARRIRNSTAGGDEFHIALSGGNTPTMLYRFLAENYAATVPWERVHFYWGDERCVPPDNPESNYGMAHRNLLKFLPIAPANIHRMRGEAIPEEEASRYEREELRRLPTQGSRPAFDLVLLGLGNDGHTASLFPNQPELLRAPAHCAVATHPSSGLKRITLTAGVLNAAKCAVFLVAGREKSGIVSTVLRSRQEAVLYPASFIKPQTGALEWWLDRDAAEGLD